MSTLILSIAAAATAEAPHGAEETASGGLPQFDPVSFPSQLFWLVVTFGFLYWIMSSMVLPRLGGTIEERRDRIADDFDQAAEFKRQAEEAEKGYNQSLADAKAKSQAIAAEKRAEIDADIASMQAEADAKDEATLKAAEEKLATMKSAATAKVREAASDTAKAIVTTLIDETPTDDAISGAVNNAIGGAS